MVVLGDSFVTDILGKVVHVGFSYLKEQRSLHEGMKDELENLREALPQIQAVVEAAEGGQLEMTAPLKQWLWHLKDTLYDANDVLDTFEYRQLEKQVMAAKRKEHHKLRGFLSKPKDFIVRSGKRAIRPDPDVKELRGVMKRLDKAAANVGSFYNLVTNLERKQQKQQDVTTANRETGPLLTETVVLGRDREKEQLIQHLITCSVDDNNDDDDDEKRAVPIVSVVGHGGMGKTTLAQLVYNDKSVEDYFDLRMWVCVSNTFQVNGLTRKLLESATKRRPQVENLAQLQDSLKRELMSCGKFLIVLDDAWNDHDLTSWESFFAPLRYGCKGSRIVLTTRLAQVAEISRQAMGGDTHYTMELRGLPENDCFSLFYKYAFGDVNPNGYRSLLPIGKQITEKLGGLPLAAKMVGRMLHSNLDVEYWKNVLRGGMSIARLDEGNDNIMSILQLSYHHLPKYLRPCFAYCGMFPQDFVFDKERMVRLWMALSLVRQSQSAVEKLEDIGGFYFDALLQRSFFELHDSGGFIMHDLLNELARSVSDGECSFFQDGYEPLGDMRNRARHLIVQTDADGLDVLEKVNKCEKLQTLWLLFDGYDHNKHAMVFKKMFKALKCLRILVLYVHGMEVLPDEIGDLKHLRFLQFADAIYQLPRSMNRLDRLQFLCVEFKYQDPLLPVLPPSVKFVSRKVGFPELEVLQIGGLECWEGAVESQQLFPRLCQLYIIDCPSLERLPSLPLSLRKLKLDCVGLTSFPTFCSGDSSSSSVSVSVSESATSSSLISLQITDCGDLKSLADSFLECQLVDLKELEVKECSRLVQLPLNGFKIFHSLVKLIFCGCDSLVSLPCSEAWASLISLKELTLVRCDQLISLGGLHALSSCLSILVIENCPRIVQKVTSASSAFSTEELAIDDCSLLLQEPFRSLTSVKKLSIGYRNTLGPELGQWLFQNRTSLTRLALNNTQSLEKLVFGESALDTCPNIEHISHSLQWLPSDFKIFSSLKMLHLFYPKKLLSLPELPSCLRELYLYKCNPMLLERCQENGGADWDKIAHIPSVSIC